MTGIRLLHTIKVHNTLGECIVWDDLQQRIWWTDIHNALLYSYHLESENLQKYVMPERLCAFGFIENDSRLICAFASGFAFYDPVSTNLQWLARPEEGCTGLRLNDGRVDRQGRYWAGSMVEGKAEDVNGKPAKGSLYCLSGTELTTVLTDIEISNSLCWSLDSRRLYFADSPTQTIHSYDFNPETGDIDHQKVFARTEGESTPDGSTIDAEGYLWNAQWGASKVVRYSPDGKVDCEVKLPASQPTCVCFAGAKLNLLVVSSARESLSNVHLAEQPEAGNVFIFNTPYVGSQESRFRL